MRAVSEPDSTPATPGSPVGRYPWYALAVLAVVYMLNFLDRQILSMRLVYFEDVPPSEYPWSAQALITTHDLPTVAGLWNGSDLTDQQRAGRT